MRGLCRWMESESAVKDLPVCQVCGWYVHGRSDGPDACIPKAGKHADELITAIPEVPSTKLGYGRGNFVFEPDPNFHIRFRIAPLESVFHLEDVWLLDELTHEDAADLVKTLIAWRERSRARMGFTCTCKTPQPSGHHTTTCEEQYRKAAWGRRNP